MALTTQDLADIHQLVTEVVRDAIQENNNQTHDFMHANFVTKTDFYKEIEPMKEDIHILKQDVRILKQDVNELKVGFARMEQKLDRVIDMFTVKTVELRHDLDAVNEYLHITTGEHAF